MTGAGFLANLDQHMAKIRDAADQAVAVAADVHDTRRHIALGAIVVELLARYGADDAIWIAGELALRAAERGGGRG
jgi:hypothetical protein